MQIKLQPLILAISAALMAGCAERQLYQTGQDIQRENCRNGPFSKYEDCMAEANRSFEDYKRTRDEVTPGD
jgi:hypothetical protein